MATFEIWSIAELAAKFESMGGSAWASYPTYGLFRQFLQDVHGFIPTTAQATQYAIPANYFKEATGAAQALSTQTGSASQAWSAYQAAQGATSSLGAATSSTSITKAAQVGSYRVPADTSTGYAFKPAALLKVPLPTAAAAIAPIIGVGLGYAWYQTNPELFETVSRRLLPFAYEDGYIPAWGEAALAAGELVGKVFFPDSIVDAVIDAIKDAGAADDDGFKPITGYVKDGVFYEGTSRSGGTLPVPQPPAYTVLPSGCVGTSSGDSAWVYNTNGYDVTLSVYEGGRVVGQFVVYAGGCTHYYYYNGVQVVMYGGDQMSEGMRKTMDAYRTGEYGEENVPGTFRYGPGDPWVPLETLPDVVVGIDSTTGDPILEPGYPSTMPLTPYQTPSPEEQNLDDPVIDPSKQIDPFIQPGPTPGSDPYPSPDQPGQPSPKVDPSQYPEGEPSPEPGPSPEPTPEPSPEAPITPTPVPPPPSTGDSPTVEMPDILPPFGPGAGTGIVSVYNPSPSILYDFARWLWVTYEDATIEKIWNNPFDGIITLFELYCTPPVIGDQNIRSGFLDSRISSPIIDRYTEINCGNIVIPEYYGNYLDYSPYSKAFIYLPFIGIVEVEVDDIVGHAINITYRIDCYNGSCIAMITVAKNNYSNLLYQFSGNCAVEVPITGGSQASIKAAIIQATVYGLGSVISGVTKALSTPGHAGVLPGMAEAGFGAATAFASTLNAKSSVHHSGSFGASFGALGGKIPYIIIKRPIQVQVYNYETIYGFPAHAAVTIGTCTGYIRCREVHVTSATASNEEKAMIENLLKSGVIM